MKRFLVPLSLSLLSLSLLTVSAPAQDSNPAAEAAAKQGAEERYERMAADIQALQAANDALQSKITALQQQIQDLRNQQSQTPAAAVSADDLKHLAEKIEEVDKKREDDKQAIADEIRNSIAELKHAVAESPVPARVNPARQPAAAKPAASDKGFVYKIQQGDSLSAIVKAYNADFKTKGLKTITLKQAMDANPQVDWNRLRVGQKIIIPQPESQ